MPFTPAHAAIVLPMARLQHLSATALVIGSMAPDVEYFVTFSTETHFAHTWPGLLVFDIPAVLIVSVIFHRVVKKNLIANLPVFLQERFHDTLALDFVAYLKARPAGVIVSAAIGAASHIVWDSFTHADGFFVRELPVYDNAVVPFDGARYPLFYALQHISTYAGLFVLAVYILLKKRVALPPAPKPSPLYWVFVLLTATATVLIRFAVYAADYSVGNLVVCAISGLCIGCMAAGALKFRSLTIY